MFLLFVLLINTQVGADIALAVRLYDLGELTLLFGIPFHHTYSEEINVLARYNFSVEN